MKIIATFAKQIITLTDQEYASILPIISDVENRFCQIHGQTYNINDFRFMGDSSEAPPELKEAIKAKKEKLGLNNYLPEETPLADLYFKRKAPVGWSTDVRALAEKVWKDHLARRPELDKKLLAK